MRLARLRQRLGRAAGLGLIVAGLSGCATFQRFLPGAQPGTAQSPEVTWNVPPGPGPALTPVRFDQLPGWTADSVSNAMPAFLAGCAAMSADPAQSLGGEGEADARGGTPEQWQAVCNAARAVLPGDDAAARSFFEANFQPFGASSDGSAIGLFTGYYEPEVAGSRTPDKVYRYPIYRRPPDLGTHRSTPYFSRSEIENGALSRKHLELLWLRNPIDVFFLHVQGAGRVRLPDGRVIRVTYDGQNGLPYVPIGRVLVDRGVMTLDQVSMQSVRAWLVAHPDQARGVMDQNQSFIFFHEVQGIPADEGAPGTLGAPLSPRRSIAVDKSYVPLGTPVWIDTKDPVDGAAFRRLMMAQDLGGAIRGPVRADIFFGWGQNAENRAGLMRQRGTEFLLLPKTANDRTALR
jgi:membrane-bound lytic murein transglycosylase A